MAERPTYQNMEIRADSVNRFNGWIANQDAKLSKSEALDALLDLAEKTRAVAIPRRISVEFQTDV